MYANSGAHAQLCETFGDDSLGRSVFFARALDFFYKKRFIGFIESYFLARQICSSANRRSLTTVHAAVYRLWSSIRTRVRNRLDSERSDASDRKKREHGMLVFCRRYSRVIRNIVCLRYLPILSTHSVKIKSKTVTQVFQKLFRRIRS